MITPYLTFNSNCKEVLAFYREVFHCEEPKVMCYGDYMPEGSKTPPELLRTWVMHGEMVICGTNVWFADEAIPPVCGDSIKLSATVSTVKEAKSIFDLFCDGGEVTLPPTETFYSVFHAAVTDKFGVNWNVVAEETPRQKGRNRSMPIQYRQATLDDLKTVTGLLRKLYAEHHTSGELLTENQELLSNPTQAMFLAFNGSDAIGVAHVSIRCEYVEGAHNDVCGYLEAIYIEPECRHQGIAKDLVAKCEKWSVRNDCTLFASDCELENIDSQNFHLRIGFTEASRNIHFVKQLPSCSATV